MSSRTKTTLLYISLLAVGFCCPVIIKAAHFHGVSGILSLVWLYAFLELACRFQRKKEYLITGAVFTAGYCVLTAGVMGNTWGSLGLTVVFGLLIYAGFVVVGRLTVRWNNFPATLVFPGVWLCLYLLATALRFPSLVRTDMMFADMTVLLQAERVIGAAGFSFALLWLVSLLRSALADRKPWCAWIGGGLVVLLLLPGIITLYPTTQVGETVRAAYTTGPYIGDFLNYSNASYEENAESLTRSVESAAEQNADILVFSEEAFALADTDEERFLSLCSEQAKEHGIALLVGLDVTDSGGEASANEAVLIDSSGEILGTYRKSRLIPLIESDYASGDGTVPSYDLDLGGRNVKVSFLICYDSNFPGYVRTLDPDTDILFLPSWDWSAVTQCHAQLCRTLAVMNQVYILKPTYDGLTVAVSPDGQIFCESSTDTTGFEQVRIAEIPIKSTCETVLPADTLSPLLHAVVGTEIMAAMLCGLLLIISGIKVPERTRRSRWFTALVVTELIGCCADAVSWLLDGAARLNSILYISSVISMLVTLLLLSMFCSYLTEYIREKEQVSRLPVIISWAFVGIASLLTIIAVCTGDLFVFENGHFVEKPLYTAYVFANAFSMVIGLAVVWVYHRSLDRMDRGIAYTYMTLPVVMALINVWIEDWGFAYPTIALSLMIVYIMLQSDKMHNLEQQRQIVSYRAAHDELTGLLNRRAFNDQVARLETSGGNSGIVFGDVNGLKHANDMLGHEAGDRLLLRYADILAGIFRAGDIYRIGGDEFICLVPDVSEAGFAQRIEELKAALLQDEPPLACIGAVYGSNRELGVLVKSAEKLMYADKLIVHKNYPELKR